MTYAPGVCLTARADPAVCQTQPGPPPVALLAASTDPASREDLGKPPTLWLYQARRNSCPDTDEADSRPSSDRATLTAPMTTAATGRLT